MPAKALANSRLEAQVTLRQSGFGGTRATLTMLAGGNVVASREILLKGSGQQIENLEFNAGAAGVKNLEVKLNPLPGEENLDNNRLTRVMSVDDSKRHILYVEGEPRWEYKFLRRAVEDDPGAAGGLHSAHHAEQAVPPGHRQPTRTWRRVSRTSRKSCLPIKA